MGTLRSVIRGTLGRCPACGAAPLFRGVTALHETCPRCHVRHERFDGSWTLVTWLAISFGVTVGMVAPAVMWVKGWIREDEGLIAVTALSTLSTALIYRPLKGATFGALHAMGLVYPDVERAGNVIYLERARQLRRDRARQRAQGA